jgi:hypothetical protein
MIHDHWITLRLANVKYPLRKQDEYGNRVRSPMMLTEQELLSPPFLGA